MKIHYVDALAGSGKTTAAIKYALQQAELGAKIAIVQPSTVLIDQTHKNITKSNTKNIRVTKIHSDCVSGQVKDKVQDHLRECNQSVGEILLITHQTYLSLPYWHNSTSWDIIIDEIPQCHTKWENDLPVNHATITSYVELGENVDNYALISTKPGSEEEIRRVAECRYNDAQDKLCQDLCEKLNNYTTWDTYARVDSWNKVVNGEEKGKHSLVAYSLLRPLSFGKYKSVTIMGAMFTESVLYLLWKDQVTFVEHAAIASGLVTQTHTNGNLLTIKYMFEKDWSKTFRDSKYDGDTIQSAVKAKIDELMDGEQFIYAANNDDKIGLDLGYRVPNICHGLNKYERIHNAVFMSAINNKFSDFGFMQNNNVSPEELKAAQSHQIMYQTIMRTSLRKSDDTNPKTVIVMDKKSAEYLQTYFPDCVVEAVGMVEPEKKKAGRPKSEKPAMTSTERSRLRRAKLKAEKEAAKNKDNQ